MVLTSGVVSAMDFFRRSPRSFLESRLRWIFFAFARTRFRQFIYFYWRLGFARFLFAHGHASFCERTFLIATGGWVDHGMVLVVRIWVVLFDNPHSMRWIQHCPT